MALFIYVGLKPDRTVGFVDASTNGPTTEAKALATAGLTLYKMVNPPMVPVRRAPHKSGRTVPVDANGNPIKAKSQVTSKIISPQKRLSNP